MKSGTYRKEGASINSPATLWQSRGSNSGLGTPSISIFPLQQMEVEGSLGGLGVDWEPWKRALVSGKFPCEAQLLKLHAGAIGPQGTSSGGAARSTGLSQANQSKFRLPPVRLFYPHFSINKAPFSSPIYLVVSSTTSCVNPGAIQARTSKCPKVTR